MTFKDVRPTGSSILDPGIETRRPDVRGNACLCGDVRHSIVLSGRYQRLDVPNYAFEILKCEACGLARTSPIPDPSQYDAGFSLTTKEGEFVGSTEDEWSASVARDIARRVKGGRLIDIGCHVGNLVQAAAEIGFEAFGIDLDPVATAVGRRLGRAVETGPLAEVDDSFDVAVLVQVLEHVYDLRTFLFHLKRVLVPRGLVFIYVPHYRGLVARLMRENWIGWFPQQHAWHFTPATLVATVEGAGSFRVVDCTTRGVIEPPSAGMKGSVKAGVSAFSRLVAWGDEIEAVFERA